MRRFCLPSSLFLALAVSACSSDSDSPAASGAVGGSTATGVGANQPGTGGTSAAQAGAGGSNAGNAGGGESADTTLGLNQGGGSQNAGTPGAAGAGDSAAVPDAGGSGPAAPSGPDAGSPPAPPDAGSPRGGMSFFVTSRGIGTGGNFGGLAGADRFCTTLAGAVSPALGAKTWRAYLSTSTVSARDRIGTGPWTNAAGVVIGTSVAQLHDQAPGGASQQTWPLNNPRTALDERGNPIPQNPVLHDILTGSVAAGTVSPLGTCGDWTQTTGTTSNGHSNRAGQATNGGVASSWNFAHVTGCAEPTANFQAGTVSQGGGRGSIYCFATD